jgi:small-conductance mechanosensitive channel
MITPAFSPSRISFLRIVAVVAFGLAIHTFPGRAQQITPPPPTEEAPTALPGAPVQINGKTLFYLRERVGSITATERAAIISQRLEILATNPFLPDLEVSVVDSAAGTDIVAGDQVLLTLTDGDARAAGKGRLFLASELAGIIRNEIQMTRSQYSTQARLAGLVEGLALIGASIILVILFNRLYRYLARRVNEITLEPTEKRPLKVLFFRSRYGKKILFLLLNLARFVLALALFLIILPLIFSQFPNTARMAREIGAYLIAPFSALWSWFFENIQEIITIALIILATYLLVRISRYIFSEIELGTVKIGRFEPDWAPFTHRIVSFLLIVLAIIVAFPLIPGSDSDAFRGISVFLGFLFTLSSTAAISNVVAGVIQTYTGAFRVGDIVKIGEITGIVAEKRLLTTRLRTFKNEEVSIPNSGVLSSNVVNYSTMAKGKGVVLYTTVTIGYDAAWQKVHELLIAAALATPHILDAPRPFVLQTSLNDYHVSYQLNCYTNKPEYMMRTYSALHANIQDQFNQAGVEIMSPAFAALRDGNTVTIPEENRPQDYQPLSFRVHT